MAQKLSPQEGDPVTRLAAPPLLPPTLPLACLGAPLQPQDHDPIAPLLLPSPLLLAGLAALPCERCLGATLLMQGSPKVCWPVPPLLLMLPLPGLTTCLVGAPPMQLHGQISRKSFLWWLQRCHQRSRCRVLSVAASQKESRSRWRCWRRSRGRPMKQLGCKRRRQRLRPRLPGGASPSDAALPSAWGVPLSPAEAGSGGAATRRLS